MTLLVFEGFDHLSSTPGTDLGTHVGWTMVNPTVNVSKVAGFIAGNAFRSSSSSLALTWNTNVATNTTLIPGLKYRFSALPGATRNILWFLDSASAVQCGISIRADGKLIAWRGTNATVLGTGTTTLLINTWYDIEVKAVFSNTGSIIVKLDGVTEISTGSVDTTNTANQNAQYAVWENMGSAINADFDDLHLCDDVGSAPHNDFLGPCRVETLYPTSADATAWTPNASTNVSRVQETANDGDTTYNSTASAATVDTFNHGSLASTPVTIFGVAVHTSIRKDDVTAQTARNKLKSGATTTNGASISPATTYSWMVDQYITDPNTSAAWSAANVNATKIGYEHV